MLSLKCFIYPQLIQFIQVLIHATIQGTRYSCFQAGGEYWFYYMYATSFKVIRINIHTGDTRFMKKERKENTGNSNYCLFQTKCIILTIQLWLFGTAFISTQTMLNPSSSSLRHLEPTVRIFMRVWSYVSN